MFMQNKQSKEAINNEFIACTARDQEVAAKMKSLDQRLKLYKVA